MPNSSHRFTWIGALALLALAGCNAANPAPAPAAAPTASSTPSPTPTASPTPTVPPAPSLPPELLDQFPGTEFSVERSDSGAWVAVDANQQVIMTYDAVSKDWQLPDLFPGLPPTTAEFPKIADSDPLIALLVQKDRAIAEAPGFFSPRATEAKVGIGAGGIFMICDEGAVPCIKDMESFSRDVTTDRGIVTQFFIIRAIKVPVTEKTPKGVVVWACFLGENPYFEKLGYNPDRMLSIAKMTDGRLTMLIRTGRSAETTGTSFDAWFDNSDFAAEMEQMKKEMAIWNLDWPVSTWIQRPETP